jgi:microcystin-dependent protein
MRTMMMGLIGMAAALVLMPRPASAQPYVGEIRMVAFDYAPQGWALCNGQVLSISQNTALFSLLGTTYGGDGRSTFALPDLRGRIPIHAGTRAGTPDRPLGSAGGTTGTDTVNLIGKQRTYGSGEVETMAGPAASAVAAGGSADDNMPPFLTVNYIISLTGIFPPRN